MMDYEKLENFVRNKVSYALISRYETGVYGGTSFIFNGEQYDFHQSKFDENITFYIVRLKLNKEDSCYENDEYIMYKEFNANDELVFIDDVIGEYLDEFEWRVTDKG